MFGLLISGRPVNPQPSQVGENQYAFRVPSSPPFSHLALFLLPGSSFPAPDVGATVWVQIPPSTEFRLLGALAPQKQSAIFKINTGTTGGGAAMAKDDEGDVMVDETAGMTTAAQTGPEIVIGISLEPASSVEAQLANLKGQGASAPSNALVKAGGAQTGSPVSTKVLAQRIIGNAFNFLASFGSDTVPLKAFQDWWTKFEKKVDLDPSFLEREQG